MIRRALAVAGGILLVAVPPILAAGLWLRAGSMTVFSLGVELPVITASVDIKPESLERRSQGPPVTALIEAPGGAFDVRQIVVDSIRLCLEAPLCEEGLAGGGKPKRGDADGDGLPDLKVTFERGAVLAQLISTPAPATVSLTVSAVLTNGTAIHGVDAMRLVDPDPTAAAPDAPHGSPSDSTAPSVAPQADGSAAPPSAEPTASPSASVDPGPSASIDPGPSPSIDPTPSPSPVTSGVPPNVDPTPSGVERTAPSG